MPGRLKAIVLLAVALVRTVIKRLVGRGRRGVGAFRANYDADRLPPVTAEEREAVGHFGRCIACGMCDRGEARRIAESRGTYRGVMELVLAASRSMPDFKAAAYGFRYVPEHVLADKERICPARVPFRKIARFVHGKAAELGDPLSVPPSLEPPVRERRAI